MSAALPFLSPRVRLFSTPSRDDAVAFEFSTFFMVHVVRGVPPGWVVLLDGALQFPLATINIVGTIPP